MKPERNRQIDRIFQAALEREPIERAAFLNEACADDPSLRREVEALLDSHKRAGSFIESPAVEAAALLLADQKNHSIIDHPIGPYRILSHLGSGGMGEVYLAQDSRLGRKVALKILPEFFTRDEQRVRRFKQEARAASALNHPNIITIHEIGESEGRHFIATEYVEGETLRQRIAKGKLSVKEALDVSVQVASGLAAAHQAGIVHRDIKPENIVLRRDGYIKVLDFGLAKLTEQRAPTDTALTRDELATEPGTVMGTVLYMSPEQARGQDVDARTDVFSVGVVLYEMIAGRAPFDGATESDVIAAILKEELAPLGQHSREIPPELEWTAKKALAKDREERYQTIRELHIDLKRLRQEFELQAKLGGMAQARLHDGATGTRRALKGVTEPDSEGSSEVPVVRRKNRERLAWIAATAILFLGLIAALPFVIGYFRRTPTEVTATRFVIPAPEKQSFLGPSISPDGRHLVYAASTEDKQELWIRQLDSLTAQPLPGTGKAFRKVFWSPDSHYIGFWVDGKLKSVDFSGAPAQTLADAPAPFGGSWNREGVIIFSPSATSPLYRVSEKGGEVTQLTTLDESREEIAHRSPFFLPDDHHFLYIARSAQRENSAIYVGSLDSKETKLITRADSSVAYSPPGYLLFAREGTLMAQPFDADKLQVRGEAFPIIEHIRYRPGPGLAEFSVSSNGVLVYITGNPIFNQLTWFDRGGRQLGTAGLPGAYNFPRLSPDEKRVAVERTDPPAVSSDIWLIELARGVASRFTSDPGNDFLPVWSPDATRIAFSSNREGQFNLYQKHSGGAGGDEELLKSGETKWMQDWSPDGRFILYGVPGGKGGDIWVLPLFGERKPYPLLQTEFNETNAKFSPDGAWVAYASDETGTNQVYVQQFQGSGSKWCISTGGGNFPRWRRDGKEIFYVFGRKLMAVDVKPQGSGFEPGVPKLLFERNGAGSFDVTGDGQRFLVRVPVEQSSPEPITVVMNWTADLKR